MKSSANLFLLMARFALPIDLSLGHEGLFSAKPIQRLAMNKTGIFGRVSTVTLEHVLHRGVRRCHCTIYIY
jgi:hypothetical protein